MSTQQNEPHYYASPESTNQYQPPMPQYLPQPAAKKRGWVLPVAIAASLVFGGLIGSVSTGVTAVTTATSKTAKAPPACLKALDLTETAFGYASDSLTAIGDRDFVSADRSSAKLKALGPDLNAAKTECRSAG